MEALEMRKEQIRERSFVLLDCDTIQITKKHCCIRKIYMLGKDGMTECELEFIPCAEFNSLDKKYQRAFIYCCKNIHKLDYQPKDAILQCKDAENVIKEFASRLNAELILYKGGSIEKRLCEKIDIDKKVDSHSPKVEVNLHYNYLLNTGCLFELPVQVKSKTHLQ